MRHIELQKENFDLSNFDIFCVSLNRRRATGQKKAKQSFAAHQESQDTFKRQSECVHVHRQERQGRSFSGGEHEAMGQKWQQNKRPGWQREARFRWTELL